jgi:general secretion pathway protein K
VNAAARARRRSGQRGAALLVAMLVVTVVATLTSGMVWQQWRAVQVESAERARVQAAWILAGALDWARLILREDARSGGVDHLGEPWAVPLAEARLASFLAADAQAADDAALQAFLSGSIVDAQARYNLRNLVNASGQVDPRQVRVLRRLCERAGLSPALADEIALGLRAAWGAPAADTPLAPRTVAELRWLGVPAEALAQLEPWLVLLPTPTPVNLNTASAPVLAAVLDGLDEAGAQRLLRERELRPFDSIDQARQVLGADTPVRFDGSGVASAYFVVQGRMRIDARVVEERSLVQRIGREVIVLQRERVNMVTAAGASPRL